MNFILEWGMISGFAGLALGTLVYLFREVIRKKIFSRLTNKQTLIVVNLFMILVWSISLLSIFFYFSNNRSHTQLTIFVMDIDHRVVLENEGRINIPLGNRSLNETIGPNGRINFPDIPSCNIGDTIFIGLDAKGWELVGDKKFVFTGEPIHVIVKRDNSLGVINGVVKSRNGQVFIKDALVRINADTAVLTDEFGNFKIVLPKNMQVQNETDSYLLTISKKNFKTKTQLHFPNSSDAEIRLNQ